MKKRREEPGRKRLRTERPLEMIRNLTKELIKHQQIAEILKEVQMVEYLKTLDTTARMILEAKSEEPLVKQLTEL